MATARFIPSCLVQRHVLHPRLCVELWVQDHDGMCVLQDRVHTTLWSDRACLIFLLRSRAISSSLASGGNYSNLYRLLHPTSVSDIFRSFSSRICSQSFIITLNIFYLSDTFFSSSHSRSISLIFISCLPSYLIPNILYFLLTPTQQANTVLQCSHPVTRFTFTTVNDRSGSWLCSSEYACHFTAVHSPAFKVLMRSCSSYLHITSTPNHMLV